MTHAEAITAAIDHLRPLPLSVVRLWKILEDPDSDFDQIEKIVELDPAMTANLLRLTNSAYYGFSRRVQTVRQAITLLGLRQLFDAVTGAAVLQVLPARLCGYEIDARVFWKHCVGVAVLAVDLGVALHLECPELTFTAGLLHDLGKLAISEYLLHCNEPPAFGTPPEGTTLLEYERTLFGTDHCEVGETIALRWKLPPAIEKVVRYHHSGTSADDVDRLIVDLVHVADGLAHSLGYGNDVGGLARRADREVVERLGLTVQVLERIASESLESISVLVGIFKP